MRTTFKGMVSPAVAVVTAWALAAAGVGAHNLKVAADGSGDLKSPPQFTAVNTTTAVMDTIMGGEYDPTPPADQRGWHFVTDVSGGQVMIIDGRWPP